MSVKEPLRLREEFPPVSTKQWEDAIRADLKGADYDKKVIWRTDEGIAVKPFYRSEDLPAGAEVAPGQYPFTRGAGAGWKIAEAGAEPAASVRADQMHEAGATAVQELGYALADGVEQLASAVHAGRSVDEAAKAISFCFAVGGNYFFEIAKLRAARMLWAQAVKEFGPKDEASCRLTIHARTALENKTLYDPYVNLLRVTTEALSAVVGGCDTLTVVPARFTPRLAKNVQLMLKEESHLEKVADPAGGSYYVEALTESLARAAWKLFQEVEAAGGYQKAMAAGTIAAAIAQARAAKDKAVAARRRVLVGTNNYPNIAEHALAGVAEMPKAGDSPFGVWRAAEAFEKLRLRSERHAAAGGKTPKVLLLERGDLKMRKARSTFCLNFFGCGGFAVETAEEFAGKDADLIVLCSSDPEYLEIAKDVCAKVKVPVVVAGNPKEQAEELKAAGVAGFVHVMSDPVATLTAWQNQLGVKE
jgi:methylmalonyl-CoA mutase